MQTAQQHYKLLTSSDTLNTDYDWVIAGLADTQTLIQNPVIANHHDSSVIVTVKFQKYINSAYVALLTIAYTIEAGASEIIAEIVSQVLIGAASNPDKVTVSSSVTLTSGETIDCLASSVKFE